MLQQSKARLRISDMEITGVEDLTIVRNVSTEADTLSATIPNPEGKYSEYLLSLAADKRGVKAYVGTLKRFEGLIDGIGVARGRQGGFTIQLAARDFTAKLMEMPIPKGLRGKCKGLSASQIIMMIGKELGVLVNTDPTTRIWPNSWVWKEGATVWGVIKELALKEGYLAYVDHYQASDSEIVNPPVIIFRERKGSEVAAELNFDVKGTGAGKPVKNFSVDIDKGEAIAKVTVISYSPEKAKKLKSTAKADGAPEDAPEIIIEDGTLKDEQLVKARAEQELKRRMQGKSTGQLEMNYFTAVNPEDRVTITGAGIGIDGTYYVTEVEDRYSKSGGSTTTIRFGQELEYQIVTESDNG